MNRRSFLKLGAAGGFVSVFPSVLGAPREAKLGAYGNEIREVITFDMSRLAYIVHWDMKAANGQWSVANWIEDELALPEARRQLWQALTEKTLDQTIKPPFEVLAANKIGKTNWISLVKT